MMPVLCIHTDTSIIIPSRLHFPPPQLSITDPLSSSFSGAKSQYVCVCVSEVKGHPHQLCSSVCTEILLQRHGGRATGFPQVPAPAQTQAAAARHGQNGWSHQYAHLQWPQAARQRDHGLKRTFLSLEKETLREKIWAGRKSVFYTGKWS